MNLEHRKIDERLLTADLDIQLDGLGFTYKGSSHAVLDSLSLDIKGPQLVSILGPNGAGKSTLIHCMNKILEPTGGTVMVNDKNVNEYLPYIMSFGIRFSRVFTRARAVLSSIADMRFTP